MTAPINVAMPSKLPRWGALVPWSQNTWYVVGERIANNGNVYTCTTAGASLNSGTGPAGVGAGIGDGSVVWTGTAFSVAWSNNGGLGSVYAAGTRVTSSGNLYQAIVGGTGSTTTGPSATSTPPGGIVDGTVRWVYLTGAFASDLEPLEQQKDTGWVPGQQPPAQYLNWLGFEVYRWILWLSTIASQVWDWTAAHTFEAGLTAKGVGSGAAITATPAAGSSGVGIVAGGATLGTGDGVHGLGGPNGGDGVVGLANFSGSSGITGKGPVSAAGTGVEGKILAANKNTSIAVWGDNGGGGSFADGEGDGVFGTTNSPTGSAVHGKSLDHGPGVLGECTGDGPAVAADGSSGTGPGLQAFGNHASGRGPIALSGMSSAPALADEGDIYYDTTLHKLRIRTAGAWETITSV